MKTLSRIPDNFEPKKEIVDKSSPNFLNNLILAKNSIEWLKFISVYKEKFEWLTTTVRPAVLGQNMITSLNPL